MTQKSSALGRGLSSLIPQKGSITERVIPEARTEVLEVAISNIQVNPRQPRHHFSPSDLEDLMASIKEYGILQPLVVTREGRGYELIAGERRLRASTALGLEKVPVIVRDANEQEKLELALIENIQRQDLNVVEEALAYRALIDEFNLRQDDVAKRVGKSRSVVANALRLLDLSEEVLSAIRDGNISKSHARALLSEPDLSKRQDLFERMLLGEVSTREAEKEVTGITKRKTSSSSNAKDPNLAAHEKKLREIFGTKVTIKERGGKGKISIDFYSKEELSELLDQLTE